MGTVEGGSNVVVDGLIYYLDSSNVKSYISGDTSWNDLSRLQVQSGSLINGITFSQTNYGSLVLDGINDYIGLPQITTNQTIGNYSFSIWFSFTNTRNSSSTSNSMIMEAQNTLLGGVDNYLYALSNATASGTNGRMGFQTFNPLSILYTTTNTWVGGQWYNIVCTYDITTSRQSIYVNGVLENFITIANCYFNTNTYFSIGAYTAPPTTWFFNGRISNFMVYNKTLSSEEIVKNYNTLKSRFDLK
jgi:hypothetical protein